MEYQPRFILFDVFEARSGKIRSDSICACLEAGSCRVRWHRLDSFCRWPCFRLKFPSCGTNPKPKFPRFCRFTCSYGIPYDVGVGTCGAGNTGCRGRCGAAHSFFVFRPGIFT